MTNRVEHYDDKQLQVLVFADEDTAEYSQVAGHVEHCQTCQQRLEVLTGSPARHERVGELLSGYVETEFTSHSRMGDSETVASGRSESPEKLDFLSAPSHPEMLGRLGRYEIERVIGVGGMGIVLKGFDTELNRPVAIKTLARHLAHSGSARQRFAREARAAAAVVHENVVAIHNVETDDEVPFLVMQLVAGESLQTRVEHQGPLDPKEVLRIGMQAAAGLEAAHEQGVIHRDVKPANILLERGVDRALLTDFGLARTVDDASLTHTGIVAGTPHYMSPEQADGQTVDHRTDLFSLGSVLYFMATGRPPFRAERPLGVLKRICHDQHRPAWEVNPEIPDALSDTIEQLLEKKPNRRLADAGIARAQMSKALSQLQQPTRSAYRRKLHRWASHHRTLLAFCGCALLLVVAGIAYPHLTSSSGDPSSDRVVTGQVAPATPESIQSFLLSDIQRDRMFGQEIEALQDELNAIGQGHENAGFQPTDDTFEREVASLRAELRRLEGLPIPGLEEK